MHRMRSDTEPVWASLGTARSARNAAAVAVLKRMVNAACAGAGLVLFAPLFCAIALLIKLDDRGPVFYSQERIGKNFKRFRMIKFRTMVDGAEKHGRLTVPNDPRATRVGAILRRSKLDELPQLINVIKGDMQFVGARPEVEEYVELFRPQYAQIVQDHPGITDPATLAYRNEERVLPLDEAERAYISQVLPRKIELSTAYMERRNFFSDLWIVILTVFSVARSH
jgi:lipopolysaccharide/colanic/teichoic acid biosynthesis glycosyltransferase